MSRKVMERSEAMSLATLISDVDSEGRREMAKFLAGGIGVEDFVPYFRRQVARQLEGDRLKPKQRMRLQEWAVRYGLKMMAGEEPRTLRVVVYFSADELERVELAAAGAAMKRGAWLREAALEKLAGGHGGAV